MLKIKISVPVRFFASPGLKGKEGRGGAAAMKKPEYKRCVPFARYDQFKPGAGIAEGFYMPGQWNGFLFVRRWRIWHNVELVLCEGCENCIKENAPVYGACMRL